MRRTNWKTVSTLVTMVVVAGCSERVAAPLASSSSAASVQLAPTGRPSLSLHSTGAVNGTTDFTVGPRGGVFFVGRNAVIFPAGSICDPSTSSYGFGTWDEPCTPLASDITIHAVTRQQGGRSWVDFTPSLRFVPTTDASHYVWMYMSTPSAKSSKKLADFTIFYAPSIGGPIYDESLTDPTLTTYVDTHTGQSLRRIKHFSGYTSMGLACDVTTSTDPTCQEGPGGGGGGIGGVGGGQ